RYGSRSLSGASWATVSITCGLQSGSTLLYSLYPSRTAQVPLGRERPNFQETAMSEEKGTGIRWPRIPLLGATKKLAKKLWVDLREYAKAWVPVSFLTWF